MEIDFLFFVIGGLLLFAAVGGLVLALLFVVGLFNALTRFMFHK